MYNIALLIEYDGSDLNGFQKQPNPKLITIQGEIEKSLEKILNQKIKTVASGRTDAGVSAEEQYITFITDSEISAEKFRIILNNLLIKEIAVKKSFEVPLEFHPRYDAIKRSYRYRLHNSITRSPMRKNRVSRYGTDLNFELMEKAWNSLVGKHDFYVFSKENKDKKTTLCDIYETKIEKVDDEIVFYITGRSFLRCMIRLLVGATIRIGEGKDSPNALLEIIESQDKSKVKFCADSKGLTLTKIEYPEEKFIFEQIQ